MSHNSWNWQHIYWKVFLFGIFVTVIDIGMKTKEYGNLWMTGKEKELNIALLL